MSAAQMHTCMQRFDLQKLYTNMYIKSGDFLKTNKAGHTSNISTYNQVIVDIPRLSFYNGNPTLNTNLIYGLLSTECYGQDFTKSLFAQFCQCYNGNSSSKQDYDPEQYMYNNPLSARDSKDNNYETHSLLVPCSRSMTGPSIFFKILTFIKHKQKTMKGC